MTLLELTKAGIGDVDQIVALVTSAYRGDASRAGWTTEADLLHGQRTDADEVRALIDNVDSVVLLAHADDGTLLASCNLQRRDEHCAYFGMFAVSPSAQGSGLGRSVLAAAEAWARAEWGTAEMVMTVIGQRSELIAYYERRGYENQNTHQPFPYGDERFGIPQRDDLYFTTLTKRLTPR